MGYESEFRNIGSEDEKENLATDDSFENQPSSKSALARVFRWPWNWRWILCSFGLAAGVAAIAFGITCLVFSQSFKAKDPIVTIQTFAVSGFHINSTGSLVFDPLPDGSIAPFVNVTALIENPNSYKLYVDYLSISVYYSTFLIALSTSPGLPPVYPGKNITAVIPFNLNDVPVFRGDGGHALLGTLFSTKVLNLQFFINTKDHVEFWNVSPPPVLVKVACNITVEPMSAVILGENCTKYHKTIPQ